MRHFTWRAWLRRWAGPFGPGPRARRGRARAGLRLRLEALEERATPATADPKVVALPGPELLTAPQMAGAAGLDAAMASALAYAWAVPAGAAADRWVVEMAEGADPSALNLPAADAVRPLPYFANAYLLDLAEGQDVASFGGALAAADGVAFLFPLFPREMQTRFVPNDPLFSSQWHLQNTGQTGGTPGADANVVTAWDDYTGSGVVIGIVDDGLQYTHPDLSANYLASASFDFNFGDNDPAPDPLFDFHGTAVAGVAAGAGDNGVGVAGAAFGASLAGLRLLAGPTNDLMEASALSHQRDVIDIYNNSWGPFDTGVISPAGPLVLAALRDGVLNGRGGLGSIYVWAAGNGLLADDNVNYDGYANSRYTIAVSAIDHAGRQAFYSEPGAPILVAAYSNGDVSGITTTDLTGANGYNAGDYTSDFGGTSSAAPLVSGVVALMLEANPNLTYRDVQHILVETARQNDPTDPDWTTNGAGRLVNHKYGFGAIDARAAVDAAVSWVPVGPELSATTGIVSVNKALPDASPTPTVSTAEIFADIEVEWVEVVFNAGTTYRGDLEVVLVSPSGTRSVLASPHFTDSGSDFINWTYTSARHWGESAAGTWRLEVRDGLAGDLATWFNWTLNVYGHEEIPVNPTVTADDPGGNGTDNGQADSFRLVRNGSNVDVFIDGTLSRSFDTAFLKTITVLGSGDRDTLEIDYSGGDPVPPGGITFTAGAQPVGAGDGLVLSGGGPFQTAALAFTGPGSGTAALDADGAGGAAPSVVTFTGVEAVTSGAGAADLAFSFAPGGDQAVLEDDGNPGNGVSRLRSANGTFPTTTFAHPSAGVTLTAGSGDAVTVSLAEVLPGVAVRSGAAAGYSSLTVNLPDGPDQVLFGDDGTPGNGASRVGGPTLTPVTFDHPTGPVALNAGPGDVVTIGTADPLGSGGVTVSGADTIAVDALAAAGAVTLAATGAVREGTPDAAADVTAGSLAVTAGSGIDLDVAVGLLSLENASGVIDVSRPGGGVQVTGLGLRQSGGGPVTVAASGGPLTVLSTVRLGGSVWNATGTGSGAAAGVELSAFSTLFVEANGPTPGGGAAGHGQLNVTGTVKLGGALNISGRLAPTGGGVFVIVRNDGSDPVQGTFDGLPQGALVGVNGVLGTIVYDFAADGDGQPNDVAIVVNGTPTAHAGGPYTVPEGGAVALSAAGSSDPEQPASGLSYVWDLDGDGAFGETGAAAERGDETGVAPTFSAAGVDGPATFTVAVRVTDGFGASHTAAATVTVANVPPAGNPGGPYAVAPGGQVTLTGSAADPAGAADPLVFAWDLDGDGVFGETGPAAERGDEAGATVTFSAAGLSAGSFAVRMQVSDGDGGVDTEPVVIAVTPGVSSPGGGGTPGGGLRTHLFAAGADVGGAPRVTVYNADGSERFSFFAFDPSFRNGVRVAMGDLDGDGIPDVIAGAGPLGGPHVRALSGLDGSELASFFAYDFKYTGGVFVAAGDVNGDGRADIITGTDAGGGPHVKAFDAATGAVLANFFAYDPAFTGGVRVAADPARGLILTSPGPGGGPHVRAFAASGAEAFAFFAYEPAFTGGVNVASGDLDGDGSAEIITAPATGLGEVRVFSGLGGAPIGSALTGGAVAPPPSPPGALPPPAAELFRAMSAPDVPAPAPQPPLSTAGLGLPVATTDRDGDGRAEIVIGRRADPAAGPAPDVVWTFPGGSPIASAGAVRVFDPLERALEAELSPFGDFAGGVFVGGA